MRLSNPRRSDGQVAASQVGTGHHIDAGAGLVEKAGRTWMIPVRVVRAERDSGGGWTAAMAAAVTGVISG